MSTLLTLLGILTLLVLFVAMGVLLVTSVAEAQRRARERARIGREASQAAWRIHAQATEAFAHLLQAARDAKERS